MENVYLVVYGYYTNDYMSLIFVNAESEEGAKKQVINNKGLCDLDTVKVCSFSDIEIVFR